MENDPRLEAKKRILEEIMEFASGGMADELKAKHAPAPPPDEALPEELEAAPEEGEEGAELGLDDEAKLEELLKSMPPDELAALIGG